MDNIDPRTLRIHGNIHSKELTILVDGGSTHNFIQDRLVKYLGLQATQSKQFNILVGNGDSIKCNGVCTNVLVTVSNTNFIIDLLFFL